MFLTLSRSWSGVWKRGTSSCNQCKQIKNKQSKLTLCYELAYISAITYSNICNSSTSLPPLATPPCRKVVKIKTRPPSDQSQSQPSGSSVSSAPVTEPQTQLPLKIQDSERTEYVAPVSLLSCALSMTLPQAS